MKRLGLWSGKIYEENVNASTIKECSMLLNSTQETITEEVYVASHKFCISCKGCPMAKEENALQN